MRSKEDAVNIQMDITIDLQKGVAGLSKGGLIGMKRIGIFIAGVLAGAVFFGGGIAYAASGVLAERSAQAVYVDGQRVELEAYLIDGANYVKLRDIGQAANFNVYWDGAVQIESGAAYTGQAPVNTIVAPEPTTRAQSKADYSAAANPEIFTGFYSREAYSAAYEVLAATRAGDFSKRASVYFLNYSDRQKFEHLLVNLANGTTLSINDCGDDLYEIYSIKVDRTSADTVTAELIREVNKMRTDREKVTRLNEWICDHIVYNPKVFVGANEIAEAHEPVEGNCASFASLMNYLCGRLGIPCIVVSGEYHSWNMIYVDGEWSYTDASLNDQVYGHAYLLFDDTPPKQPNNPEGQQFLMELLVPGSTK